MGFAESVTHTHDFVRGNSVTAIGTVECQHEIPQAAIRVLGCVRDHLPAANCVVDCISLVGQMHNAHIVWRAISYCNQRVLVRPTCTFNDPDGPYQGSIIGLGGEQIDTIGFGDTLGIYYRHFRWPSGAVLWTLQLSIWHPVASTVLVAGFPWILRSRRFSLRTLLIAMALVAVALGVLIYAAN
jgi:hypothetical protein